MKKSLFLMFFFLSHAVGAREMSVYRSKPSFITEGTVTFKGEGGDITMNLRTARPGHKVGILKVGNKKQIDVSIDHIQPAAYICYGHGKRTHNYKCHTQKETSTTLELKIQEKTHKFSELIETDGKIRDFCRQVLHAKGSPCLSVIAGL